MDKNTRDLLLYKAALFRGVFINQVTHIEKLIEIKIANHFCKTEPLALEIVDLLLGDKFISFESKRSVFEIIMKKHYPKLHKENKNNFIRLTSIQTTRNRIAHLIVAFDDISIGKFKNGGTVGFVKFKEKTDALYYSPKEMENILNDTKKVIDWLIF